jgi:phosphoribosylanthranilate isomerase
VACVPKLPRSAFVKICGVTNVDDATSAVKSGANAIGLNFADSPRRITLEQARDIVDATRGQILHCAVFRSGDDAFILDTVTELEVEMVQLHDAISDDLLSRLRQRDLIVVKALNIDDAELDEFNEVRVDAVLVDGPRPGSGEFHSWDRLLARPFQVPVILAGGLTPDNVADVIALTNAWGVDSASGVESSPRHKDHELVQSFVVNARQMFGQKE